MTHRPAPKGLLLVRSGGLGDTILFSHLIGLYTLLADPGEAVAVLTPKASVKTTFLFPDGIEVIGVDYHRFRTDAAYRYSVSRDLYRRNFRLVVTTDHLRHPWADEAMIRACQAPETIAMKARSWAKYEDALAANRRRYTRVFDSGADTGSVYERWVAFANWLNGRNDSAPMPVLPEDRLPPPSDARQPTVVIQPFSAVKAKQPDVSLFQRMVEALPPGHVAAITGAPSDLERNPEYAVLLERPGVRFDSSNFHDVIPLLRMARLVVSVDTALAHLAIAVGTPTLCLASAAYVGEIVPYPKDLTPPNVRFVHHSMPCEGCRGDCALPLQNGMYPCIARLDRTAILESFARLLIEPGQKTKVAP